MTGVILDIFDMSTLLGKSVQQYGHLTAPLFTMCESCCRCCCCCCGAKEEDSNLAREDTNGHSEFTNVIATNYSNKETDVSNPGLPQWVHDNNDKA